MAVCEASRTLCSTLHHCHLGHGATQWWPGASPLASPHMSSRTRLSDCPIHLNQKIHIFLSIVLWNLHDTLGLEWRTQITRRDASIIAHAVLLQQVLCSLILLSYGTACLCTECIEEYEGHNPSWPVFIVKTLKREYMLDNPLNLHRWTVLFFALCSLQAVMG
uniref:Uncharacterized protein n=1 Tax=Oryza brachyantha TaxID=4533 RepID=J3LVP5_ORYBR